MHAGAGPVRGRIKAARKVRNRHAVRRRHGDEKRYAKDVEWTTCFSTTFCTDFRMILTIIHVSTVMQIQ